MISKVGPRPTNAAASAMPPRIRRAARGRSCTSPSAPRRMRPAPGADGARRRRCRGIPGRPRLYGKRPERTRGPSGRLCLPWRNRRKPAAPGDPLIGASAALPVWRGRRVGCHGPTWDIVGYHGPIWESMHCPSKGAVKIKDFPVFAVRPYGRLGATGAGRLSQRGHSGVHVSHELCSFYVLICECFGGARARPAFDLLARTG
jgi:hypothetical protein